MKLDTTGENFIIKEEGMVLHPYKDSAGIPTIGIGCTYYEDGTKVQMTDAPITEERAIQLFRHLATTFEQTVSRSIRLALTQNQFNALVSLCFNIGVGAFSKSTLVKKINGKAPLFEVETWWLVWNKVAGEPILLGRRKREFELYTSNFPITF
jgi:lysozyme